jgi:hypothetical protein
MNEGCSFLSLHSVTSICYCILSLLSQVQKVAPWGSPKMKIKASLMGFPWTLLDFTTTFPQMRRRCHPQSSQNSWIPSAEAGSSALKHWSLEFRDIEQLTWKGQPRQKCLELLSHQPQGIPFRAWAECHIIDSCSQLLCYRGNQIIIITSVHICQTFC